MINIWTPFLFLTSFAISPVLPTHIPPALLATAPIFFPSPVYADLPKVGGVPELILYIHNWVKNVESSKKIEENAEWFIEKWGFDELKEYCQFLGPQHKFNQACATVYSLHQKNYNHLPFNYKWGQKYFSNEKITATLDGYLIEIGKNFKEGIRMISASSIENGWNEVKNFCKINQNWKNKGACVFLNTGSIMEVVENVPEETVPNIMPESYGRKLKQSFGNGSIGKLLKRGSKN